MFSFFAFEVIIQKRWNTVEKVKFLLITTWIPGFACLIYYYIKFANTRTEADLYFTGVHGSSSFAAAVAVVAKQLMVDSTSNKALQVLYRYVPLLYLCTIAFLSFLGIVPAITFAYSFFGLLFGWIYLRFFQKHTDGKRGDFRNSFSFVRFFPHIISCVLALPINCIYAVFVAFKICPKMEQQYEILSASSLSKDVLKVSYNDSDRYKRIALQDLNARLAKKQEPLEEWPALFDDDNRANISTPTTPEKPELKVPEAPSDPTPGP